MMALAATSSSVALINTRTNRAAESAIDTLFDAPGVAALAYAGGDGDVFVALEEGSIKRCALDGTRNVNFYSTSEAMVALAFKDDVTLVAVTINSVALLNTVNAEPVGPSISIPSTGGPIESIALSPDKEFLCIMKRNSAHICQLSSRTTTPLSARHIPRNFRACAFHPTRRGILTVGCGDQVVVYDATKPNSPQRIISSGRAAEVVDMVFLSGAKNLLAVAMSDKHVIMIDTERDKSMVEKIDTKHALNTIALGVDSTQLLVGTCGGTLLSYNVKSVNKLVSATAISTLPLISILPLKSSSSKMIAPASNTALPTTRTQIQGEKQPVTRVLQSARKVSAESVTGTKEVRTRIRAAAMIKPASPPKSKPVISRKISGRSSGENVADARTGAFTTTRGKPASPNVVRQQARIVFKDNNSGRSSEAGTPQNSPGAKGSTQLSLMPNQVKRQSSLSPAPSRATTGRTLSPDLPTLGDVSLAYETRRSETPTRTSFHEDEDKAARRTPTNVVDLSTPPRAEISQIIADIRDGDDEERCLSTASPAVVYQSPSSNFGPVVPQKRFSTPSFTPGRHGTSTPPRGRKESVGAHLRGAAMQISPMKSPARPPSLVPSDAQAFLRNVVREAMLEREEEQREELRSLHVDVVRLGRVWKNDLRSMMEEYLGDFKALHQENERLRAENERLRRGY